MTENWVLNASPLIVLARIGYEDLLPSLAAQVVVPRSVAEEIQAGPDQDPARKALAAGRFTVVDTPPPPPEQLAWDLGRGETAVLSLAFLLELVLQGPRRDPSLPFCGRRSSSVKAAPPAPRLVAGAWAWPTRRA